jgi:hypothetical protein
MSGPLFTRGQVVARVTLVSLIFGDLLCAGTLPWWGPMSWSETAVQIVR